MQPDAQEPVLPYTPSNTGRKARVGYLGFDGVGFNDLWPLFAGLVLSIALALRFFLGEGADGRQWLAKTLLALLPFGLGFGYLRVLVVGRPPHFKGDLWAIALGFTLDPSDPAFPFLPFLPRARFDTAAAAGPARAANLLHPLSALRSRGPQKG
ncbi:MAG TPA: hypothetical protein VII09_00610 [Opitutaceae bacterium]